MPKTVTTETIVCVCYSKFNTERYYTLNNMKITNETFLVTHDYNSINCYNLHTHMYIK